MTTTILDEDHYPYPDTEYHYVPVDTTYMGVWRGDQIGADTVQTSKSGTKWTELRDKNGKLIKRELNNAAVTVMRRRETDESRERYRRAENNRTLAIRLSGDLEQSLRDAQKEVNEHLDNYYSVDYSRLGRLLEAQANFRVWARFRQAAEWLRDNEEFDGDLVDAKDRFVEQLMKGSILNPYHGRAISRSSNVLSNLLEDIEHDAEVKFIHDVNGRIF